MSESHIFRVTNTKTKFEGGYNEDYGYWEEGEPAEGSLAWAIQQAEQYYGDETPVILFTKAVSGKTLKLGKEQDGWGQGVYCSKDLIFRLDEGVNPITISSVPYEPGYKETPTHSFESLTLEQGITLNAHISVSGTLRLDHTTVKSTIFLNDTPNSEASSRIVGEGIVFASKHPIRLYTSGDWDGSPESVQELLDTKLAGADYSITSKDCTLHLDIGNPYYHNGGISGTIRIDDAWQAAVLPKGFTNLVLGLQVAAGGDVTIAAATTLNVASEAEFDMGTSIYVEAGGKLTIEPGVKLVNQSDLWYSIYNNGELNIQGCDLTEIQIGGGANLTNCWGRGDIDINPDNEAAYNIQGCDLSKMTFCLNSLYGAPGDPSSYDSLNLNFSSNYWGTTNVNAIMKKFYTLEYDEYTGYSRREPLDKSFFWSEANPDGLIKLGDFLSSAPEKPNLTPPALKLGKTLITNAGDGVADVTLSWACKGSATFSVLVDGDELISNSTALSHTIEGLADGDHSYTVIATNVINGISTTQAGTFSFDATAPEVTLGGEEITKPKNGKAQVVLTWEGNEEGAKYLVMVDGKKAYNGTKPTCKLNLADGEHTYTITATDKAGNTSAPVEGSFSFDATAPVVQITAPRITYASESCGKGDVTLHLSSDEEATYKLTLNGEEVPLDDPTASTITLKDLADGKYKYTLTAVDAAGNESKALKGNFTVKSADYDVTPPSSPELKSISCKVKKENQSEIKLSWIAPEKGATYIITAETADGTVVATQDAKGTSCTFKGMEDGTYTIRIVALDKAGNRSEALELPNITADSIAPVITELSHAVENGPVGSKQSTASLSWKGEEGATYIVKLGGKTLTFTQGDDGRYSATYKNGRETATCTLSQDAEGTLTYDHPFALKDGKYKYSITAIDEAGNKKEYKGAEALVTNTKSPARSSLAAAQLDQELGLSAGALHMPDTSQLNLEGSMPSLDLPQEDDSLRQGLLA